MLLVKKERSNRTYVIYRATERGSVAERLLIHLPPRQGELGPVVSCTDEQGRVTAMDMSFVEEVVDYPAILCVESVWYSKYPFAVFKCGAPVYLEHAAPETDTSLYSDKLGEAYKVSEADCDKPSPTSALTDERDSVITDLQQQLESERALRKKLDPQAAVSTANASATVTKCLTIDLTDEDGSPLPDSVVADKYSVATVDLGVGSDYTAVASFIQDCTLRVVFQRKHVTANHSFSMNNLVHELQQLADGGPVSTMQQRHLPDNRDALVKLANGVLRLIKPRHPSGHLIDAREAAAILLRVMAGANKRSSDRMRESLADALYNRGARL